MFEDSTPRTFAPGSVGSTADQSPIEASIVTDPRDPLNLSPHAPLLRAWLAEQAATERGDRLTFTTPGHHYRTSLLGEVNRHDLPMYSGVAPMKESPALLEAAEDLATATWGADIVRFSVSGSTQGNQAAAFAVARPGDNVIISRTLHRSMLLALVLADLNPIWVRPDVDEQCGLPTSVRHESIATALAGSSNPTAVFIGDPSYVGTISDVSAIADVAHQPREEHPLGIPLVVDAAWAPHFGFHPDIPGHAIARGADAMVVSAHKALPSYTQAALVMARTERIERYRFIRGFEATNTTSPSATILASIDGARALMDLYGRDLLGRLLDTVAWAKTELRKIPGLDVLEGPHVDPTKLVLLMAGTGAHGHAVERELLTRGISLEMADRDVIIPLVTMADEPAHVATLVDALKHAIAKHRGAARKVSPSPAWLVEPEVVMSPREAFFAPHKTLPASEAIGQVCAELIAPYPPGVPVLSPGERITSEAVEALQQTHADGGRVAYAADSSLATIQVVD